MTVTQPESAVDIPGLDEIREARGKIGAYIRRTPVWLWKNDEMVEQAGVESNVYMKLELLQETGTFKARGAIYNMLLLNEDERRRGVTAVSVGNHAIAVAFAARLVGSTAKVVMPRSAPTFRVEKVRSYGGEVVLVDDVHAAFAEVERIAQDEGRVFIHPFEGRRTIVGQATLGLELCEQIPDLEAVIIPIGGGGLAAGMATAIKQMLPACRVYGVEPEGANSMWRSFQAGSAQAIEKVTTFADSLGAPQAAPYSYALCRHFLDDVVLVSDDALKESMRLLFHSMKLACEPACAASTAGFLGPLREQTRNKTVALIACGSNIDLETFCRITSTA